MAKHNVQFSKDNEYYTPQDLVARFGLFDYDPATTPEKAAEFGVSHFDTIETNGLKSDWCRFQRIWCNPPFTIKHLFLEKAQKTFDLCGNDIFLLVPIEFLTTKRFHALCRGAKVWIPDGRIKFESGLGKKSSSPAFGSVILKIENGFSIEPLKLEARP